MTSDVIDMEKKKKKKSENVKETDSTFCLNFTPLHTVHSQTPYRTACRPQTHKHTTHTQS